MKKSLSVVAGVVIFALILFLAREPVLRAIGSFLIVRDELKESDVIVVLGGESDRVDEAARLYHLGFAKYIIMSGGSLDKKVSMVGVMRNRAVALGVPRENVILEPQAQSTYQHPGLVEPIMRSRGFTTAIVVSSPYHMRRSAMLFDRALGARGIGLIYHPVQESWFDARYWWTDAASRRAVGSEYLKLAVNIWGNGFSRLVGKLVKER